MRAAVIGASGIGKHHAKWLQNEGCEVVAFVGSSEESAGHTQKLLQDMMGFAGRGYWDVMKMLEAEHPDLVSVCTPMPLHHDHVLAALRQGAHVMCEKPLAYDPAKKTDDLLAEGREMVEAAGQAQKVLAVNTQYAAAVEPYYEVTGRDRAQAPTHFSMRMESRGHGEDREYEPIWIDLASHPISVMLALLGPGEVDWNGARCTLLRTQVEATFDYVSSSGARCACHLVTGSVPAPEPMTRAFGLDRQVVDYEGRNDAEGVYAAYLSWQGREARAQDFVHTSLQRFVQAAQGQGQPLADGQTGLRNLEIQLRLLDRGEKR
jgi:predicted dehydrogenase